MLKNCGMEKQPFLFNYALDLNAILSSQDTPPPHPTLWPRNFDLNRKIPRSARINPTDQSDHSDVDNCQRQDSYISTYWQWQAMIVGYWSRLLLQMRMPNSFKCNFFIYCEQSFPRFCRSGIAVMDQSPDIYLIYETYKFFFHLLKLRFRVMHMLSISEEVISLAEGWQSSK